MIVTQEPIIRRCKFFAKIKVIKRCAKLTRKSMIERWSFKDVNALQK